MLRELLGLRQDKLLPVAVRLVMDNVRGSVIPAALLVSVLCWVLNDDSNTRPMLGWAGLTIFSKLVCWQHARYHLGQDHSPEAMRRIVWQLVVLNALDGVAWGALAWVTLDTSSLPGAHWCSPRSRA